MRDLRRDDIAPLDQHSEVRAPTREGGVDVLPRGWYKDPYDRWRARYWDGWRWTENVANQPADPKQRVYGRDPLQDRTDGDGCAPESVFARVEALYASELARLRREADSWRMIAEERQRALATLEPLMESLRAGGVNRIRDRRDLDDIVPTADATVARAAPPALVAVPSHVRAAAMFEMATVEARLSSQRRRLRERKNRRWWSRRQGGSPR